MKRREVETREASGTAVYLYCIGSPRPAADLLAGIRTPDGAPIRIIGDGPAWAVVRTVARERYGEQAAARFASDLEALGEEVRHHEIVAERLLEHGCTVLPGRFGLLYRDDEALGEALAERRKEIDRALARLAGREEWGLRLWGNRSILAVRLAAADERARRLEGEITRCTPGRAFLARRKRAELVDQLIQSELAAAARDLLRRVEPHVEAARALETSGGRRAANGRELACSVACLVARDEREAFLEALAAQSATRRGDGFVIETTGPWPAYNFLDLLENRQQGATIP